MEKKKEILTVPIVFFSCAIALSLVNKIGTLSEIEIIYGVLNKCLFNPLSSHQIRTPF